MLEKKNIYQSKPVNRLSPKVWIILPATGLPASKNKNILRVLRVLCVSVVKKNIAFNSSLYLHIVTLSLDSEGNPMVKRREEYQQNASR